MTDCSYTYLYFGVWILWNNTCICYPFGSITIMYRPTNLFLCRYYKRTDYNPPKVFNTTDWHNTPAISEIHIFLLGVDCFLYLFKLFWNASLYLSLVRKHSYVMLSKVYLVGSQIVAVDYYKYIKIKFN